MKSKTNLLRLVCSYIFPFLILLCTSIEGLAQCTSISIVNAVVGQPADCTELGRANVQLSPPGGLAPYVISLVGPNGNYSAQASGTATSIDINNIPINPYTSIVVTTADGCSDTTVGTFDILDPNPLAGATLSTVNSTCNESNGAIEVDPDTTGSFTYIWSSGDTTVANVLSNLLAGSYTVTITDSDTKCLTVLSTTVENDGMAVGLLFFSDITGEGCDTGGTATINHSISPGVSYQYLWSDGQITKTATSLAAGAYAATVTSSEGCSASSSVNISANNFVTLDLIDSVDINCPGDLGTIKVGANGTGTPPYNYLFEGQNTGFTQSYPNETGEVTQTGLEADIYTVTVEDSTACTGTLEVTFTVPSAINISPNITNVVCPGDSTGSIQMGSVSGGNGSPYTFSWSNTTSTFSASTKNINGVPAGNYIYEFMDNAGCSITDTLAITEPPAITASFSVTNATCNGDADGAITVTAAGGTSGYTYSWTDDNSITSPTRSDLAAGVYTVKIKDANNCSLFASATVGESNTGTSVGTLTFSNIQEGGCDSSGVATVNHIVASGVIYQYLWNDGQTIKTATNLTPATYTVTVTSSEGCSSTGMVDIPPGDAVVLNVADEIDIICNGYSTGRIRVNPNGTGTGPYDYTFVGQDVSFNESYLNLPGGVNQTGLSAGTYLVTVTDDLGCTDEVSITLTEPNPITVAPNVNHNICAGESNGNISMGPTSGGNGGPYTFRWTVLGGGFVADTKNISSQPAGSYIYVFEDNLGCEITDTIEITAPQMITTSFSVNDATCNGGADGAIIALVAGGVPGYTYGWADDNTITTATRSGLAADTYTLVVTDANNCTASFDATVAEPLAITADLLVLQPASCLNDGSARADNAVGGTGTYSYEWDNGSTIKLAENLEAGFHTVTVTDDAGCILVDSIFVPSNVPDLVLVQAENVLCNGDATGSISVTSNSGDAPFNYNWIGPDFSYNGSNGNQTGLAAGTHTITITDANGCIDIFNHTLTEPSPISVSPNVNDVICNGDSTGSIMMGNITGGNGGPYTFSWTGPGSFMANTKNISNLPQGTYSYTFGDSEGCTITGTHTITEPAALDADIATMDASCNGSANGSAIVSTTGGLAPYTYLWSDPSGQTTPMANGLAAGAYEVTITDASNCMLIASATVNEPDSLLANVGVDANASCLGINNGVATAVVSGGTPIFSYIWESGDTTAQANNLPTGNQTVTITDANACIATSSIFVPADVEVLVDTDFATDLLNCNGDTNGQISITVTNGNPAYTYDWNGILSTEDLSNLGAGNYDLTVTDADGCKATATYVIAEPTPFFLDNFPQDTMVCDSNYTAQVLVSGNTPPYTYNWPGLSSTTNTADVILEPGSNILTVEITDANGCQITDFQDAFWITGGPVLTATSPVTELLTFGETQVIDLNNYYGNLDGFTYDLTIGGGISTSSPDTDYISGNALSTLFNFQNVIPVGEATYLITPDGGPLGDCPVDSLVLNLEIYPVDAIDFGLFIPEIFTPNGDGKNDVWQIKAPNGQYPQGSYKIFNRNGAQVTDSDNLDEAWDGAEVPDGSYYVIVKYADKTYKGPITKISQ